MNHRNLSILVTLGVLVFASSVSLAQEASPSHSAPLKTIGQTSGSEMVPSLAVLNSAGATLKDGVLTLSGVTPNSIIFADRPWRSAGHVQTSEFIKQWGEGKDSFAADPPNATISVLGSESESVEDAVVVLKNPKLAGDTLTFDVEVLEGELASVKGPAALFIDWFAARGPRGGFAVGGGAWRAPVWRGAYYAHPVGAFAAGAAVGAAAARPYYYPQCGYYPYPPCY